jgi:bifunctional oligoribonuclease and PAP phosphatase NrnA
VTVDGKPSRQAGEVDRQLERAARRLAEAPRVALACHVHPDPDAAGSMMGLAHFLAERGTDVVCSWGNQPMEVPRWLSALDGSAFLVEPAAFPQSPEVLVALDTAAPDRLGLLAPSATRAQELIVLDHHRTNPGFGTILVLDPEASSTAEIVFRLIERMGGELSNAAAACLYAGIVADTGRFQYESTTPETLRAAAHLRTRSFDHTRMAQVLFEDNPLSSLRLVAAALARMVLVPEVGLVWTYVTQQDLARASVDMNDTDDLIDILRTTREADVACVVKQQRDGRFKVSLRSKGETDVGAVALSFEGGGHRLASGYTSPAGLEETIRSLVAALSDRRTAFSGELATRRGPTAPAPASPASASKPL